MTFKCLFLRVKRDLSPTDSHTEQRFEIWPLETPDNTKSDHWLCTGPSAPLKRCNHAAARPLKCRWLKTMCERESATGQATGGHDIPTGSDRIKIWTYTQWFQVMSGPSFLKQKKNSILLWPGLQVIVQGWVSYGGLLTSGEDSRLSIMSVQTQICSSHAAVTDHHISSWSSSPCSSRTLLRRFPFRKPLSLYKYGLLNNSRLVFNTRSVSPWFAFHLSPARGQCSSSICGL